MNHSRKNTDSISAAQRHLQAASNILLSTSPHISAFLASQAQPSSESSSHTIPDNCRACGNALVPGWSCTTSNRRLPERPSKKSKTKSKVAKKPAVPSTTYIDYECSLCHGKNTFKSDTQPPARRSKTSKSAIQSKQSVAVAVPTMAPVARPSTTNTKGTTATPSPAPSTAASSSSEQTRAGADKKRGRKQKLGGLQAMLAKSKTSISAPAAFDFMDFMKTT
ncbi:hypothetical protein M438DRAFT_373860 [Aureobasidium pullulans EXF-150]|uniref:Uncharacterized protein n=2 Tax=Aureobasidium pullulans TaxID=5580 RepID=A0A074XU17_AURPU|nr:uncharacterized protein M438DRAFT_373860 [Aureobasidium pullulans EXF-150]KEQ85472.1 hypothetical protein M438DRAFT_373860 [Aureobasidium pullulans EXF-150]THW95689.1 hypothetical protein D6D15_01228 [Aureobasidium pullulans]